MHNMSLNYFDVSAYMQSQHATWLWQNVHGSNEHVL